MTLEVVGMQRVGTCPSPHSSEKAHWKSSVNCEIPGSLHATDKSDDTASAGAESGPVFVARVKCPKSVSFKKKL